MGRSLGSVNKKKAKNKDMLQEFIKACEMVAKESSPEAVPEPVQEDKAGPILIKGKRSTRLMYEVLPWARHAKYNELAVTE
jgi:hypothetical protein